MRTFLAGLCVVWLLTAAVSSQTVTRVADWDQPNATVAEAQAYAYALQIDAAAPVKLAQTCATVGAVTHCTAPVAATFTPGTHTLTLTAVNAFGSASATVTGAPPSGPITFTLKFTISIP
jgi:hypothetical protein